MVTLRRKQSRAGTWLYQVCLDDHSDCLPQPPWYPADHFCTAIRGAVVATFLQDRQNEVEFKFTQEEWNGYFRAACVADLAN